MYLCKYSMRPCMEHCEQMEWGMGEIDGMVVGDMVQFLKFLKWEVDLEIVVTIPFANYEIQIMAVDCNADAKRERRSTMVKLLKRHYKDKIGRSLKKQYCKQISQFR